MTMIVPSRRNFFDDFMMSPFDAFFDGPNAMPKQPALMKTDIKETDSSFELTIDLPGIDKENVTAHIENGYLEVAAESRKESEEKAEDGSYLRKERFEGKCSRKFYVGEEIVEDDISAKFENGVLQISVPKRTEPLPEAKKTIAIEG